MAKTSAGAEKAKLYRARRRAERRDYQGRMTAVLRLCRRLEAGDTVADACREPEMPPRATLMYWVATYPELAAMVEAAEARAASMFGPRRTYTFYDADVAAEVLSRLEHGRALVDVCAERDMPSYATVQRWRGAHPEFEAAYQRAREAQADRLFDLAWRIACEAGEDEVKTARLKIQAIRHRIARLSPRAYGPQRAAPPAEEAQVVSFVVRRFALTPDRRMVEITDAIKGLTNTEIDVIRQGFRAGRLRVEDVPGARYSGA